jgi:hypothetical protein
LIIEQTPFMKVMKIIEDDMKATRAHVEAEILSLPYR